LIIPYTYSNVRTATTAAWLKANYSYQQHLSQIQC